MGRPSMSEEAIRNNKITIIKGAMEMINEKGIQSLSARALGSRIDMNSALIYRYFKDIDEVILYACVNALQEYTADMVTSSQILNDADDSYDSDIFMLSWEIFCRHAFSRPEEFNILFFSRHSVELPEVAKEFLTLFPPSRDDSSDIMLEAMFSTTSLQNRNLILLVPILEGKQSENDIILINDMIISFFYALLIQLLGQDRGVTPEIQTKRMLQACRKVVNL